MVPHFTKKQAQQLIPNIKKPDSVSYGTISNQLES